MVRWCAGLHRETILVLAMFDTYATVWSDQVTQGFIQSALENLQGQRSKNLPRQPVPVPDHNSEEV